MLNDYDLMLHDCCLGKIGVGRLGPSHTLMRSITSELFGFLPSPPSAFRFGPVRLSRGNTRARSLHKHIYKTCTFYSFIMSEKQSVKFTQSIPLNSNFVNGLRIWIFFLPNSNIFKSIKSDRPCQIKFIISMIKVFHGTKWNTSTNTRNSCISYHRVIHTHYWWITQGKSIWKKASAICRNFSDKLVKSQPRVNFTNGFHSTINNALCLISE